MRPYIPALPFLRSNARRSNQPSKLLRHEGALGYRRVIDIGAPIADALGAAHALGMLPRDLNPENVMLTRQGRARLLDFGLGEIARSGERSRVHREALDAQEGVVLGTVGYISRIGP